jgi:uncharacterized linocin/CFP29 family protein
VDILKKELAPISEVAWKEIEEQIKKGMTNYLTARKFVDIDGPNGFDFGAVSTGRLTMPGNKTKEDVSYGIRSVLPLVEARKAFTLDQWELDNVDRGAMDIDLESLEKATKQLAAFEENVIYKGLKNAGIKGLAESNYNPPVLLPSIPDDIIRFIGAQINLLQRNSVDGPYSLVINEKYWLDLINLVDSYPIMKQLKELLGGQVIVNDHIEKSFLVSERGGDFELTIGQDVSVGYEASDARKVKLYLTESFTFRVLSPEAVIVISAK